MYFIVLVKRASCFSVVLLYLSENDGLGILLVFDALL